MTGSVRWIMTTAPSAFDLKPLALDKGASYTFEGEPLRKVIIDALQADRQMDMYNSERDDDGEAVFFSMFDKEFADHMVHNAAFAAMVRPIIGDNDMATRNNARTTRTTTKTPATPVVPAKPAAPTKEQPKLGAHLQAALDAKKQRDLDKAAATQALLADKKPVQAPAAPAKPLIMTPNTPPPAAPVSDEQAEKRAQALQRLVKVEAEVKEITAFLTQQKLASRVTEQGGLLAQHETAMQKLAATVTSQQGVIDNLLGAISDMVTRMSDLENAVASFMVDVEHAISEDVAPAKPLDVFDVLGYAYQDIANGLTAPVTPVMWGSELDAPAAVQAPVRNGTVHSKTPRVDAAIATVQAKPRAIPARGTGAMSEHAHLLPEIRSMVDAGFSQKDIAVHFNICGEDGKPSGKVIWHLLNRK